MFLLFTWISHSSVIALLWLKRCIYIVGICMERNTTHDFDIMLSCYFMVCVRWQFDSSGRKQPFLFASNYIIFYN